MFTMLRAKASLLAPFRRAKPGYYFSRKLGYPELLETPGAHWPELQPYEGLAGIWDEYARDHQPNYPPFLRGIAQCRGVELRSILDLACGTGTLTARLAQVAPEVVGLDASECMLAQAQCRCSALPGVDFTRGDFRSFGLGQQFDAVVCAFNSLNYLAKSSELGSVFRSVAQHLRSDGFFAFDTLTHRGMGRLGGRYVHVELEGGRFAMRFEYDAGERKEKVTVLLPAGFETHRRISIDPEDVLTASQDSGLVVNDYFSNTILPGSWYTGSSCFFVLTRRI